MDATHRVAMQLGLAIIEVENLRDQLKSTQSRLEQLSSQMEKQSDLKTDENLIQRPVNPL